MKLPFNRERMRERNLLDDMDEIEQAAARSPVERLIAVLDLSDFCLSLARERRRDNPADREEAIEEKARLWGWPRRGLST